MWLLVVVFVVVVVGCLLFVDLGCVVYCMLLDVDCLCLSCFV